MVIVFRTSILNESGYVIKNTKVIAKNYVKGRFFLDLLSSFPFDFTASLFIGQVEAKKISILGLFKLIKVLRLGKIILLLNIKKDFKDSIRLV
jgi:hypothetical protein